MKGSFKYFTAKGIEFISVSVRKENGTAYVILRGKCYLADEILPSNYTGSARVGTLKSANRSTDRMLFA